MHHLEDHQLPFPVVFGINERIPVGGVLGDGNQRSSLRRSQIRNIFSEIEIRGGLYTVLSVAERNGIEIDLENLILGIILFQIDRAEDFPDLSADVKFLVVCDVFNDLLGDGGSAEIVGGKRIEVVDRRHDGALEIDARVLPKAFVLDRNRRILDGLGYVGIVDPDTVFIVLNPLKLKIFVGFLVERIQDGGKTHLDIFQLHLVAGVEGVENIDGQHRGDDTAGNNSDHHQHRQQLGRKEEGAGNRYSFSFAWVMGSVQIFLLAVAPNHPSFS